MDHVVLDGSISMNPQKVEAVMSWETPINVTGSEKFLRLIRLPSPLCLRCFQNCGGSREVD